jgi:hypothetical protein
MSHPRHAKHGGAHRAVPPPTQADTPPAPDDERVEVPDPRPAPEPREPAEPWTWETMAYSLLSESELRMSHPWDPDFLPGIANFDPLADEDHIRWVMFDRAIDREPEIE